jgi:hypothetical protein
MTPRPRLLRPNGEDVHLADRDSRGQHHALDGIPSRRVDCHREVVHIDHLVLHLARPGVDIRTGGRDLISIKGRRTPPVGHRQGELLLTTSIGERD